MTRRYERRQDKIEKTKDDEREGGRDNEKIVGREARIIHEGREREDREGIRTST